MNNYNQKTENGSQEKLTPKISGVFFSVTVISIFIVSIASQIIFLIVSKGSDYTEANWYKYFSFLLGSLATILSVLLCTKLTELPIKTVFKDFKVKPFFYFVALMLIVGMFLGLSSVNDGVIALFEKFGYKSQSATLPERSVVSVILCTLIICVLPAIFEEIIFRGFILRGLQKFGDVKAIVISAALFALFHLSPEKTVYQFLAGLIFALVAVASKSLLPSMLLHFFNNFAVIINIYFVGFDPKGTTKILVTIIGLLVLFVGVALLILQLTNRFKFEKSEKLDESENQQKKPSKNPTILKKQMQEAEDNSAFGFLKYAAIGLVAALILWVCSFFVS